MQGDYYCARLILSKRKESPMKRTAIHNSAIRCILAPVSRPGSSWKVWPVLVKRGRWRAEPAILNDLGEFWCEAVPRVLPIKEAWQAAREMADRSLSHTHSKRDVIVPGSSRKEWPQHIPHFLRCTGQSGSVAELFSYSLHNGI